MEVETKVVARKPRKPREKMNNEKKEELMKTGVSNFSLTDEEFKEFGEIKGLKLVAAVKSKMKEKYGSKLDSYKGQELSVIASGLMKSYKKQELKPTKSRKSRDVKELKVEKIPVEIKKPVIKETKKQSNAEMKAELSKKMQEIEDKISQMELEEQVKKDFANKEDDEDQKEK
jgi:hypothetical protein